MLIHGFSLINARLLKAFGTAFYAIKHVNAKQAHDVVTTSN